MKSNHGMSVVLRVIVTGVVLIMIAMTVVFIGTGGLRRVAGPEEGAISQQEDRQLAQSQCEETLRQLCRNAQERIVKVPTKGGTYDYVMPDKYLDSKKKLSDTYTDWTYSAGNIKSGNSASRNCQNLLGLTGNSWYLCKTGSYVGWDETAENTFTPS